MSAFDTLSALVEAAPTRQQTIEVSIIDLLEVMNELETLRRAGPVRKGQRYSDEFEAAWEIYPQRPGMSKASAFKAWSARLKAGATALEMIDGTRLYADYCKAERTEPQFIKQPATFYGPGEHYAANWTPAKKRAAALSPEEQNRVNAGKAKQMLFGRRPDADGPPLLGDDHA